MKKALLLFAGALAHPAFAQSAAENAYVKGATGAIAVIGLILIVGIYKLGKVAILKVKPTTSLSLQRTSGFLFVVAFFILFSAFGK